MALIIIGAVYQNPNLALFALGLTAFIGCIPYFEREFEAHINVSVYRGKDYLLQQLKAGLLNISLLFIPVFITYIICFQWQYAEVLPLYISVPILGVLSKYAFWNNTLWQTLALLAVSIGVIYIIPVIAIPYFYYLAIQTVKKQQYAQHSH